jgi:Tol biopolymer transport system component
MPPRRSALPALASIVLAAAAVPAPAQMIERVSVNSAGTEGDDNSLWFLSMSPDGRFVAFMSNATNLVANDTNQWTDVFVRDRLLGTTERVSVDSAGNEGNVDAYYPSISADGRFVSFESRSSNLVTGDGNHESDIFVHDRSTGTTERVSVDSSGREAAGGSHFPAISADGRWIVFDSWAPNLVSGDTNSKSDIFVHDRQGGTTLRASVDSSGNEGDGDSLYVSSISADGRFVAFQSAATNLVAGDTNGTIDIFVHDFQAGTTERVSVSTSGKEADSRSDWPSLSGDGRFVAFESDADNLVNGDTNLKRDVFVRDRQNGTTRRMSVDSAGVEADDWCVSPSISADGRYVVFDSMASNLDPGDTNPFRDVFVHDRFTKTTTIVSVDAAGVPPGGDSFGARISPDGRLVCFCGTSGGFVPGDNNGAMDDFVHGRWLNLAVDPPAPPAGATLTFTTWTGLPYGATLLVVVDVNGTPTFLPALPGTFGAAGIWALPVIVPAGLAGNVLTFVTFGFAPNGKVDVTEPFAVSFQ